ncbi:type II secretion system minor pseudopilin GspJ [Sphingomicrobium sp. XHP0239]|uniref:type II secretion system minor pseudopilin GspJ n=1 Tax=Sphingomicrobium maritimum TaxID=3133972 RepID=UPI0031CC9692
MIDKRNGFTLIEMLVGLTIFALLASAGVGLLSASADTQQAVDASLGEQADLTRISVLLEADLAQVADRPTRDTGGAERPAFVGSADGMTFVRGGVVALDTAPQTDLRRVRWTLDRGALTRITFEEVDGNDDRLPDARLVDDVSTFALEYRGIGGGWSGAWPDGSGEALPRAVRMTLAGNRLPETQFVVALPRVAFEERSVTP